MRLPSQELITAEELLHISDPPDRRSELVDGAIRHRPFMDCQSGAIAAELGFQLFQHAEETRSGIVLAAGTGCIVRRNPDTVRAATISWLSQTHLHRFGRNHVGYFPCAPNLIVELLSERDDESDVSRRNADWFMGGAQLIWWVDPRRKTVTIYSSPENSRRLTAHDTLTGDPVLPGFSIPLRDIFPAD